MFFALPSAIFAVPGVNERIRGASLKAGRAARSAKHAYADVVLMLTAATCLNAAVHDHRDHGASLIKRRRRGLEDITIHHGSAHRNDAWVDHHDFCLLQDIVPRGETRLDGANNKNISLYAQGPIPRNLSNCASSSPRSWPSGHDPRSVYPATSPRHNRSQAAARPAKPDARPARNDLLAR